MKDIVVYLYRNYFELAAFIGGLLLLALMDPDTANGPGLCLLENLNFPYCPGDGLGHSISYIFRAEFGNALEANILGPFAIIILTGRISYLISQNLSNKKQN
jgi:hypothetical protein